jgi:hypothetical protein
VARHGGSANKNIGDAFLLVWKFPEEVQPADVTRCIAAGAPVAGAAVSSTADRALAAFVLTIAARAPFCCPPVEDVRPQLQPRRHPTATPPTALCHESHCP